MNTEKEMLRYVRVSFVQTVFTPVIFGMSMVCILGALRDMSIGTFTLGSFLMLCAGLYLGLATFVPSHDYTTMLNYLKSKKMYSEAVFDFSETRSFLNDRIRLGNKYVFCKHHCAILRYTDISTIRYVRKVKFFVENSRYLQASDTSGKLWFLCELGAKGEDEKLKEVFDFVLNKNKRILLSSETRYDI